MNLSSIKCAVLLVFLLLTSFFSSSSWAAKSPQGRLFAGSTAVEPNAVNDEVTGNGLKKISATLLVGMEATYPVLNWMDLGLRYTKNQVSRDEDPSDPLLAHKVFINQDLLMGVARFPIVKSEILRFDAFGGFGGATTTLKLHTSTQRGELDRKEAGDFFNTPVSAFGASLAFGYKKFFLFVEGGSLLNKVEGFKSSGTINDNIQTIDLSGPYALVGIAFMDSSGLTNKK
jgi:hypothetical protein